MIAIKDLEFALFHYSKIRISVFCDVFVSFSQTHNNTFASNNSFLSVLSRRANADARNKYRNCIETGITETDSKSILPCGIIAKMAEEMKNPSCTELSRKWCRFLISTGIFDCAIIPYLVLQEYTRTVHAGRPAVQSVSCKNPTPGRCQDI